MKLDVEKKEALLLSHLQKGWNSVGHREAESPA
jgi:hypothetical protein